jgi:WD40 repeat protein
VESGAPGPTVDVGDAIVHQVAFDPASARLAIAAQDLTSEEGYGFAAVWDLDRGEVVGRRITLPGGGSGLGVAWSPDGERLAVVADNNFVHLYDAGSHAEQGEPIESIDSPILTAAFSPDGSRLATGNLAGVVQQWDTDTHEPLGAALEGHTGPVGGVAYSPDGTILAASTLGFSRSRLWDVDTGTAIGGELAVGRTPVTYSTFLIEHYQGNRPAFTPDGQALAVGGYDGTVAVWTLDPDDWLEAACDVVGRNLTEDEWTQHMGRFAFGETCR